MFGVYNVYITKFKINVNVLISNDPTAIIDIDNIHFRHFGATFARFG